MEMNFIAIFVAALVPMVMGFIWYNPKVLGTIWMKEAGVTEDMMKSGNMVVIFGISIVLSILLSFFWQMVTIHELGAYGMVEGQIEAETYKAFMSEFGEKFRSFKHGFLHGFMGGLFIVFPIIATNGLFERKSWKYIFVNSFYWIFTLAIMGSILSGWI